MSLSKLILCSLLTSLTASAVTIPATDFPKDGSTAIFTTSDSLLTFTTTNSFSGSGDFMGDSGPGAASNLVNAYNGTEELNIALETNAVLTGFRFRWTNTTLTISGFSSDPGTTIAGGSANWNSSSNELVLTVPWDAGNGRVVTFTNPEASGGATLNFSFSGAQATFTEFSYEEEAIPLPEPLVRLSFDDDSLSGTTLNDQSTNGNHATLIPDASAPTPSQGGLFGESFSFENGDDPSGYISIPSGVMPSGASARTISLWFNAQDASGQAQLFGYGTASSGQAFLVGLEGGGIRIRHFGGNITYGSGLDFTGSDAGWHHLAVRVKDAASTFTDVDVFLNGNLLPVSAEGGNGSTVTLNTTASAFGLGSATTPTAQNGFGGFLDEFQAFDSALPAANIRELAEAPPRPTILTFTASPQNRVPSGSDVTLSWEVENSTSVTLNPGGLNVTGQSSLVVNPTTKTTYTLTVADDALNSDEEKVTLSVGDESFPNVIVFLLDDFGWSDWEQNGAPTGSVFYETPNMNRLASEGMYFPNGYASTPVCSPTRGALMSGQAPAFNKLSDWITGSGDNGQTIREAEWVKRLPTDLPNWPRTMSECGYRSIHVGKWHLGSGTEPAANPLNHGFDINIGGNQFGTPPAPERYFASAGGFTNLPNMGADVAPQGSYLTDVLTEQAVAQIKDAASSDTAFAMYLSHYAVHGPIQAPVATVAKYQAKLDNNPGTDWQGHTNPTYAAMIEHVDLSIGAIMDTLLDPDGDPTTDDSIAENTLVILTADNGGLLPVTSNRPLRDGKGGTYEGGIREPWIFWSPGNVDAGVVNPEPIVTHDIFPTVLSYAGVPTPANHEVNGADLTPLLTGAPFERMRPFTFHYPHWSPNNQIGEPYSAIRKGDWKLVYTYANKNWELYNLATNAGETNNLIASEEDRHAVLSWMLGSELEALDANYPRNLQTLDEEPPVPLVNPANDTDGDGKNDLEEAIHGTDGNDPTSFFAPVLEMNNDHFFFVFPPVSGRSYVLQASETLEENSWSDIDNTVPLSDESPLSSQQFYRIKTSLP